MTVDTIILPPDVLSRFDTYVSGDVALILGDCIDVMPMLRDCGIGAIATDPPYGLGYRKNQWDESIPDWFDVARSLCPKIIFTTAPTTMWDYPRPDWVCDWHRRAAASRSASGGFNHWTPILVYGDVKFSVDYYETAFGKTVNENKGIDHPSPKPVELYVWILSEATLAGEVVLDPFMGSGTTGVAASKIGRRFIGVEKDSKFFSLAVKRIKQAQMQIRLPF